MNKNRKNINKIPRLIIIIGMCIVTMFSFTGCSKRISAGYEGVRFNLYGDNKGISDIPVGPGQYWLGFNEEIYEFPVFIKQYPFTKNGTEGSPNNEEIVFQTKDGMTISCDVAIMAQVIPGKSPLVYKTFQKEFDDILHTIMYQQIRDAFNSHASQMTVDSVYGEGKNDLLKSVFDDVKTSSEKWGIEVDKISYLSEIRVPQVIQDSINAKIAATQLAQQRENEIATATAAAQKKIEEAKGSAKSLEIEGTALRANPEVLALRQLEIRRQAIEKWDGKLPETLMGGKDPIDVIVQAPK